MRARRRAASQYAALPLAYNRDAVDKQFGETLNVECGADLDTPYYTHRLETYLTKCTTADFLDAITFAYRAIAVAGHSARAKEWLAFIRRLFHEENLNYRITEDGVVHFGVDGEFETNLASALAALAAPKYAVVQAAFERARADMANAAPDALDAVRNVFEAAESLFKIVTGSNRSLDSGEVQKTLAGFVDRKMKDADAVAKRSAATFVQGFADWVNAAHPYRHGHDEPQAVVPPIHLAVALVSNGAVYLRWIATLDQSND